MEEIPKPDPLPLRVGLTYNLKKNHASKVADNEAEYDSIETVAAIENALMQGGYQVTLLEATEELPLKLSQAKVDIVFNIAEGLFGRGREAQVPAILDFFNIPYSGSDETTLCIALDKALTKRILASYHIRTPKYFVVPKDNLKYRGRIPFPVIVKPNAEGSSKGISDVSIVSSRKEPSIHSNCSIKSFHMYISGDILVEAISLSGREFTVGHSWATEA